MPDTKEQISSQELYNWLFEACNIMRGPINQDEYKSYITPLLLFYKRISDNWDEENQGLFGGSAGKPRGGGMKTADGMNARNPHAVMIAVVSLRCWAFVMR